MQRQGCPNGQRKTFYFDITLKLSVMMIVRRSKAERVVMRGRADLPGSLAHASGIQPLLWLMLHTFRTQQGGRGRA